MQLMEGNWKLSELSQWDASRVLFANSRDLDPLTTPDNQRSSTQINIYIYIYGRPPPMTHADP